MLRAGQVDRFAGCWAVRFDGDAEQNLGLVPRGLRATARDTTLTLSAEPAADSALFFWTMHDYRKASISAGGDSLQFDFGHDYGGTRLTLGRVDDGGWRGIASSWGDVGDVPPCDRPATAHRIPCDSITSLPAPSAISYRTAVGRLEGECGSGG